MEKIIKHVRGDWSNLNQDLLVVVASKVVSYTDFLSFKAVCSSWHMAAQGRNLKPFSFSMLVFFADPDDSKKHVVVRDNVYDNVQFLPINHKKPYKPFNTTCSVKQSIRYECMVGSNPQGWLVMLDRNGNPYLLQLFSWIRTPLPELSSREIEKATMSSNNSSNFVVLMMHGNYDKRNKVCYWRTGDEKWTPLEGVNYTDIAICDNKVYTLHRNHGSVYVELIDFGTGERLSIEVPDAYPYVKLVCSSEGEVMLVDWLENECGIREVNLVEGRCEEVNSLKGNTLIIGEVTSAFVSAKEVEDHGYKPNSVYVVREEHTRHKYLIRRGIKSDIVLSVYNLEDGKIWRSKRDRVSRCNTARLEYIPEPYLFGLVHGFASFTLR